MAFMQHFNEKMRKLGHAVQSLIAPQRIDGSFVSFSRTGDYPLLELYAKQKGNEWQITAGFYYTPQPPGPHDPFPLKADIATVATAEDAARVMKSMDVSKSEIVRQTLLEKMDFTPADTAAFEQRLRDARRDASANATATASAPAPATPTRH